MPVSSLDGHEDGVALARPLAHQHQRLPTLTKAASRAASVSAQDRTRSARKALAQEAHRMRLERQPRSSGSRPPHVRRAAFSGAPHPRPCPVRAPARRQRAAAARPSGQPSHRPQRLAPVEPHRAEGDRHRASFFRAGRPRAARRQQTFEAVITLAAMGEKIASAQSFSLNRRCCGSPGAAPAFPSSRSSSVLSQTLVLMSTGRTSTSCSRASAHDLPPVR